MSDTVTLAAEARDRVGKGASRSLRRDGRVPAVIYGQNQEPQGIHLEEKALVKALNTGHFFNSVIMVETAGGQPVRTLAKDVAFHPVTDRPLHVDFFRVGEHSSVTVNVPVVFVDEDKSPGLTRGGVLNVVRHELELVVDAAEIPSEVAVSVAGFDVGDSIHISSVTLPQGARSAIEDRDYTIATVTAPSAMRSGASGDADAAADAPAA
jgi:large subunit ribosomal protein L25